jgi:hypothetical protein
MPCLHTLLQHDCQDADWEGHKVVCKKLESRELLYSVATTLPACWLTTRAQTWDHDVTNLNIVDWPTAPKARIFCTTGDGKKFRDGLIIH